MNKTFCRVMLAAAALLGAARLADLLLCTEPATGFVTLGSAWVRYAVMGIFTAVLFLTPQRAGAARAGVPLAGRALYAAAAVPAAVAGALMQLRAVSEIAQPTGSLAYAGAGLQTAAFVLRITAGVSLWGLAVWCVMLFVRKAPLSCAPGALRGTGLFGVICLFSITVLRYSETPSSVHRIVHILPVFSALAALMFAVKLLGLLCAECTPAYARSLACTGVFAFFLCSCIELPQALWRLAGGTLSLLELMLALLFGILGLAGAAMALSLSKQEAA